MDDVAVLWVIVAATDLLIGAIIGNWRGRVFAGAVWGLVLGPIGWILVALGPDRTKPAAAYCPYCVQLIPLQQATCAHCKNRVVWLRGKAVKTAGQAVNISQ